MSGAVRKERKRVTVLFADLVGFTARANALVTLGSARVRAGDRGGITDLERSIEIGRAANSVEVGRAYGNLGNTLAHAGDLRQSRRIDEERSRVGERLGHVPMARFQRAIIVLHAYIAGDWDECVRLADAFVDECERSPHYQEIPVRWARAAIRLARSDVVGAVSDIARANELGRETRDDQVLLGALAVAARAAVELGRLDEARELIAEWLRDARDRSVRAKRNLEHAETVMATTA